MRTRVLLLASLFLLVTASGADPAEEPWIPVARGYVSDYAGVITVKLEQRLNGMLEDLDRGFSAELAILVIPTTAPLDAGAYALATFERWGIGKRGRDNGALLLVAVTERTAWVAVGYGLETTLTDARVASIVNEITPHLARGDYAAGISKGAETLVRIIAEAPVRGTARPRPSGVGWGVARIVVPLATLLLAPVGFRLIFSRSPERRRFWIAVSTVASVTTLLVQATGMTVGARAMIIAVAAVIVVLLFRQRRRLFRSRRRWSGDGDLDFPGRAATAVAASDSMDFGGGETGGAGGGGDWGTPQG